MYSSYLWEGDSLTHMVAGENRSIDFAVLLIVVLNSIIDSEPSQFTMSQSVIFTTGGSNTCTNAPWVYIFNPGDCWFVSVSFVFIGMLVIKENRGWFDLLFTKIEIPMEIFIV